MSRQAGYCWLRRFRESDNDPALAAERSRRPHTTPTKVREQVEELVVEARKAHPTWGPKKLCAWLRHHVPQLEVPAPSTVGEILKRRGLMVTRLRRRHGTRHARAPFANVVGPNATWCVDFKGHFATRNGVRCYPLMILDAHSRFLIRCEGVLDPDGREVQRIFDSAFQEFGPPSAMRSDNGPPFASVGAGGLTPLAVWIKLGIRFERPRESRRRTGVRSVFTGR